MTRNDLSPRKSSMGGLPADELEHEVLRDATYRETVSPMVRLAGLLGLDAECPERPVRAGYCRPPGRALWSIGPRNPSKVISFDFCRYAKPYRPTASPHQRSGDRHILVAAPMFIGGTGNA